MWNWWIVPSRVKPPTLNKSVVFRINKKAGFIPAFLCPPFLVAILSRSLVIVLFLAWKGVRLFQPIRAQLCLDILPNELSDFL